MANLGPVDAGDALHACGLAITSEKMHNIVVSRHSMEVSFDCNQPEGFDRYLARYGHHLTSLTLKSLQRQPPLPCAALKSLNLLAHESRSCPVQFGPRPVAPGALLDSCTGLTSLKLTGFKVATGDSGKISGLPVLSALQDVELASIKILDLSAAATVPGFWLGRLTRLTSLSMSNVSLDSVPFLSCLTALDVLSLWVVPAVTRYTYGPVGVHARGAVAPVTRLAPDIAPGFGLPGSLRSLSLYPCIVLSPAVLSSSSQLTFLKLQSVSLEGQDGESGFSALLSAVGELKQLDTLLLERIQSAGAWPAVDSAAYQALTASSVLRRLEVVHCATRCLGACIPTWRSSVHHTDMPEGQRCGV